MLAALTACDSLSTTIKCGVRALIHSQKGQLHRYHDVISVPLNGTGTRRYAKVLFSEGAFLANTVPAMINKRN